MAIQDKFVQITPDLPNSEVWITVSAGGTSPETVNIECSIDGGEWQSYTAETHVTCVEYVRFRNDSGKCNHDNDKGQYQFRCSTTFAVSGNIQALVNYTNMDGQGSRPNGAIRDLFNGSTVRDASDLYIKLGGKTAELSQCFRDCTSLVNPPRYIFGTIGGWGCLNVFEGCSSLEKTTEFPDSGDLSGAKNAGMYKGSGIKRTPIFLKDLSYSNSHETFYEMFINCVELEYAEIGGNPYGSYETSAGKYGGMFKGCSKLKTIVYHGSAFSTNGLQNWMNGVASGGTFYYTNPDLDISTIPRTTNGVPADWTIEYLEPAYLRLTSLEDNNVIAIDAVLTASGANLEYRTDLNQVWQTYVPGTDLTLLNGSWVEFRNDSGTLTESTSAPYKFRMSGRTKARGSVTTLLNWKSPNMQLPSYCFANLFNGCSNLEEAPELPSTRIASYCYQGMFNGCSSLTNAPELPAIKLYARCYEQMFNGCTSLLVPPELPSEVLNSGCYENMFNGCTSLETAPELRAQSLTGYCYSGMFRRCSSLTTPPALPAVNLDYQCYYNMFRDCSKLVTAPSLPATQLTAFCYSGMFNGCTSLETAPEELPAGEIYTYSYNDMFNGCSKLTKTPDLYCESLNDQRYRMDSMFKNCTSIASMTYHSGIFISGTNWLANVSPTGTFYYTNPDLDVASIPRDESGIPAGWNIEFVSPHPEPPPGINLTINGKSVKSLTINGKTVTKLG